MALATSRNTRRKSSDGGGRDARTRLRFPHRHQRHQHPALGRRLEARAGFPRRLRSRIELGQPRMPRAHLVEIRLQLAELGLERRQLGLALGVSRTSRSASCARAFSRPESARERVRHYDRYCPANSDDPSLRRRSCCDCGARGPRLSQCGHRVARRPHRRPAALRGDCSRRSCRVPFPIARPCREPLSTRKARRA